MAIVANDSTTALVVFHTDEDCDLAARVAVVHAVTDALLADADVIRCSSSVAADLATGSEASILALLALTASSTAVAALVGRLTSMLDSAYDFVLEVDERQIVTVERDWPLGTPTPGEHMVSLVTRAPSFTREAFAAYWHDVHAPVAMSFTILPSGYTQYVTRRSLFGETTEPDGVMVMHFRTADDRANRWAKHPDEATRGAADAAVFMDMTRATSVLMHEIIWR